MLAPAVPPTPTPNATTTTMMPATPPSPSGAPTFTVNAAPAPERSEKPDDRRRGRSQREELWAQELEGSAADDESLLMAFAAFLPKSCPFLAHYIVQEILRIVSGRTNTSLRAAAAYRRIYGLGLPSATPAPVFAPPPSATPAPPAPAPSATEVGQIEGDVVSKSETVGPAPTTQAPGA